MKKSSKYDPYEWDELPSQQVRGKPRIPDRNKVRQQMRRSSEGGRGRCHFCKTYFSMRYLRMKKVAMFQEDWVCKDCVEDRNL